MNRPAVVHHGQRALAMLHRFPRCPFLIDSRRHDRWIGIHNIPDLRVGRRDKQIFDPENANELVVFANSDVGRALEVYPFERVA